MWDRTYLPGGRERVDYPGGTWEILSPGPWRQVIKVAAFCGDGQIRVMAYVGDCDTLFSRPAAVRVGKIRLIGYVGKASHAIPGTEEDWQFHVMVPPVQKSEAAKRLAEEWAQIQERRQYLWEHDGTEPSCKTCGAAPVRYRKDDYGYYGQWYCEEHMPAGEVQYAT